MNYLGIELIDSYARIHAPVPTVADTSGALKTYIEQQKEISKSSRSETDTLTEAKKNAAKYTQYVALGGGALIIVLALMRWGK